MLRTRPKHTQVSGAFVRLNALFGLVYPYTRLPDITVCSVDKQCTKYRLYNLLIGYELSISLHKYLLLGLKRRAALLTTAAACTCDLVRCWSVKAMANHSHAPLLNMFTSSAQLATSLYAIKTMTCAVDTRASAGPTMQGAVNTRHAASLTKHFYTETMTGCTASMTGYTEAMADYTVSLTGCSEVREVIVSQWLVVGSQ